jgi:hypothetical protein
MEISQTEAILDTIVSHTEFATMKKGISLQNVEYLINHNLIDYVVIAGRRAIVLTEKSLRYSPKNDRRRAIMQT